MIKTPYLLMMCFTVPVAVGQPAVAKTADAVAAAPARPLQPTVNANRLLSSASGGIDVSFPEPMVDDEMVGTEVDPAYYSVPAEVKCQAKWTANNVFQVQLQEDYASRDVKNLVIPGGLKSLAGNKCSGLEVPAFGDTWTVDLQTSFRRYNDFGADNPPYLLIGGDDDDDVAYVDAHVKEAYFVYRDDDDDKTERRAAAQVRPATVADALGVWDAFCEHMYVGDTDMDKVREEFEQAAPDTPIPHLWRIENTAEPGTDADVRLILPGGGRYDMGHRIREDYDIAVWSMDGLETMLTNESLSPQDFLVKLRYNQPLEKSGKALFQSMSWRIGDGVESALDMKWDEGRGLFSLADEDGNEIATLAYDASACEDKGKSGGTLAMRCHTDGSRLVLRLVSPITSAYGAVLKTEGEKPSLWMQYSTNLIVRAPRVATDISATSIRTHSAAVIHCECVYVKDLTARVYRLEPSVNNTARLMKAYSALYPAGRETDIKGAFFLEPGEDDPAVKREMELRPEAIVPNVLLPGVATKAECVLNPDAEGRCTLDPVSLFPDLDPRATYFVEITGTARDGCTECQKNVNQGIVQVTDIGMMWKLSQGKIFAYVYGQGGGKPLAEATLRLLDADCNVISELPVKDGVATGDYPAATTFLQVQAGDDRYTTRSSRRADRRTRDEAYRDEELRDAGIDPEAVPHLLSHVFTDRPLYRPGETAHLKGILRTLTGGTLSLPEVESMTARVTTEREHKDLPVTLEPDGTFHLDIPLESHLHGNRTVKFTLKYKGDDKEESPDMAVLKKGTFDYTYQRESILEDNRQFYTNLSVEDFRRNEFELDSALEVAADGKEAALSVAAKSFSDIPLADAKVGWSLVSRISTFRPAAFSDYNFGDWSEELVCRRSFGDRSVGASGREYVSAEGVLDKDGKGAATLQVPQFEKPSRVTLTSTVSVTNGNQQTLNSVRSAVYDPAGVYAGLRCPECLTQAGTPIELDALLVTPEGEAYKGAPMPATLKVVRHYYQTFRYGTVKRSSVQSERESEQVSTQEIMLGGTPLHLSIPTEGTGLYDIVIEGKDADGKPYHTAICQYVWGGAASPWRYYSGSDLELTPDKKDYKVGETARILVQTPVDAELEVTVECGDVKRSFHHSVTVANPILEIPILAEDAPGVTVSVFLVQGANGRSKSALPLVKSGSVNLTIDQPEKRLTIQLDTPAETLLPKEDCTLGGVVKDAAGKPVPGAVVTLYAEDEGTLQVAPYTLPDPYAAFYNDGNRFRPLATFSMLGQMLDPAERWITYGNKGIFVGGGDDDESAYGGETAPGTDYGLRDNFTPCAVWLGRVVTDAQGRFSTTYKNPDTMTRYRVMAVASASTDLFGSAQSAYKVAQPVMLEPSAPLSAAEGDVINVPVTLAMRPDLMPAGTPEAVSWNISLEGDNVSLPQTTQTVTLHGNSPTTVTFPVTAGRFGTASLTWRVQPEQPQGRMAVIKDAVKLQFPVVPPTPNLRFALWHTLDAGKQVAVSSLPAVEMRPDSDVDFLVSINPLSGIGLGVQYLFSYPHGCTEQTSSKLLPWLLKNRMESQLDIRFPEDERAESLIAKGVKTLLSRQNADGSFSYWGGSDRSEFSPYAALALSYVNGNEIPYQARRQIRQYLEEEVKNPDGNLLAFIALERYGSNPVRTEAFVQTALKRKHWSLEDRWMFAYAAIGITKDWEQTLQRARVATTTAGAKRNNHTVAPPLEALRLMTELRALRQRGVKQCPQEMVGSLRSYVASCMREVNAYSTWTMGWCCLVINEFCSLEETSAPVPATLVAGGEQVKVAKGSPLVCTATLDKVPLLRNIGKTPVYLSGKMEGYTAKPQQVAKVNHGFDVTRCYERLEADGTWKPTGVFKVGDVVRVTFSAQSTTPTPGRYLVAEDRLPACFEAVNPAIPSQGLPQGIDSRNSSCWSWSGWIDHTEFLKDRVRAYASGYGSHKGIKVTYIARVVKSGKVTAPAAKVELMYQPEVYGLSVPQQLEIKD